MDLSWKTESLVEWAKRCPPVWATSVIHNWANIFPRGEPADILTFVTSRQDYRSDVDTDNLIGEWKHHAGHSWIDALIKDPCHAQGRMRANLSRFESDPSAYFDGRITACGGITFVSLNGGPLFADEGTHRSVIAKFALDMAKQRTGQKYLLRDVPQIVWTADCLSREMYLQLNAFTRSQSIELHCSLSPSERPTLKTDQTDGPSFWVHDERFDRNWPLYGKLNANQFRAFAGDLLTNRCTVNRRARFAHLRRRLSASHKLLLPNHASLK